MRHHIPLEVRFWARVKKGAPDECWPWQPTFVKAFKEQTKWRYGRFEHGWKIYKSHRLAWQLTHGEIPEGLWVLHKCDNPPCCNPAHLFLGTDLDNVRDCIAKGRFTRNPQKGEDHHQSKLTDRDVRFIRATYKPGKIRLLDLATHFGVSEGQISVIVNRKRWTHI